LFRPPVFYHAGVLAPVVGLFTTSFLSKIGSVEFEGVSRDGHAVSNSTLLGAEMRYLRANVKGSNWPEKEVV
jgi:hypothetical protein